MSTSCHRGNFGAAQRNVVLGEGWKYHHQGKWWKYHQVGRWSRGVLAVSTLEFSPRHHLTHRKVSGVMWGHGRRPKNRSPQQCKGGKRSLWLPAVVLWLCGRPGPGVCRCLAVGAGLRVPPLPVCFLCCGLVVSARAGFFSGGLFVNGRRPKNRVWLGISGAAVRQAGACYGCTGMGTARDLWRYVCLWYYLFPFWLLIRFMCLCTSVGPSTRREVLDATRKLWRTVGSN